MAQDNAEPYDDAACYRAFDTLVRATGFFATPVTGQNGAAAVRYPAKVAGNGLRELDRFLNLLLDAAAHRLAPASFDRPAYFRRRNAANKLRILLALSAAPSPDHERLRAIGRTRDCLFHRGGISAGQGHYADLAMAIGRHGTGWPGAGGDRIGIALSGSDRAAIGSFYRRLADQLRDHAGGLIEPADAHKRVASRA